MKKLKYKEDLLALVDADYFSYSIGFACEKKLYTVTLDSGDVHEFTGKRKVNAFLKENNLSVDDVVLDEVVEAEPVSYALSSVKSSLMNALEASGATHYKVYLQGDNNFRDTLATTLPYKSGRPSIKPQHHQNIRDYLVAHWGAEIIHNMETDDKVAMEQQKDPKNTIILTADKDLNTVCGWKYNLKKGIKYYVGRGEALIWNYCQAIMGDRIDAIQGIKGAGKMAAYKALQDCTTEDELYWSTLCAYEDSHYEKPFEAFMEMMQLLYMIRELDEDGKPVMYQPPDCRVKGLGVQSDLVVGWPVPVHKKNKQISF